MLDLGAFFAGFIFLGCLMDFCADWRAGHRKDAEVVPLIVSGAAMVAFLMMARYL